MQETSANPLVIFLMFLARCLVPLGAMLGVSYLLRKLGLLKETPSYPEEDATDDTEPAAVQGGFSHGKQD